MNVKDAICERKSIRGYLDRAVSKETLEMLMKDATRAISAVNAQPWKFYIAAGETLENIRRENQKCVEMGLPAEISDIKTAVSEAVTNCVVHAYKKGDEDRKIVIECRIFDGELHIEITDYGCGIEDVEKAQAPFYTTLSGEERSGMGFTIMQTFMDGFSLKSARGKGTSVTMFKRIGAGDERERVNA